MTAPTLPTDLEAAFARLESAVQTRMAPVEEAPPNDGAEEANILRDELEALEVKLADVSNDLVRERQKRAAALTKLDAATARLDALLTETEEA